MLGTFKAKGEIHEYNGKKFAIGTRLISSKSLAFLGLSALLLGYAIRLVNIRVIRLSNLASLVTFRSLVLVTFLFVPSLGVRRIGITLLSIHLILRRWLLLWKRWGRHGRLRHKCGQDWSTRKCIMIVRTHDKILITRLINNQPRIN